MFGICEIYQCLNKVFNSAFPQLFLMSDQNQALFP